MQGFNSQRQNLRVGIGLDFAELLSRSGHDFGKIYFGLRQRQAAFAHVGISVDDLDVARLGLA
jgi:hypothetical protein